MRHYLAIALLATFSYGCSGSVNNGITIGTAQVQAQSMFGNSTVNGGYAFLLNGEQNNVPIVLNGMFVANGGASLPVKPRSIPPGLPVSSQSQAR